VAASRSAVAIVAAIVEQAMQGIPRRVHSCHESAGSFRTM
jgi:hypothetical protein